MSSIISAKWAARLLSGAAVAIAAAFAVSGAANANNDPDNPVINGQPFVGSTLTVEIDPTSYRGCGAAAGPDYRIYWTRDGEIMPSHGTWWFYHLSEEDRGSKIEAHVASNYPCEPMVVHSGPTPAIAASNRANGFTGRGASELLARTASGTLNLYSKVNGAWEAPRTVGWGWDVFTQLLSPGDFDADGNSDVLARDGSGRLFLYGGTGDGGMFPGEQIGSGWNVFESIFSPGDFNGDGTNDVLATGFDGTLYLYPGDGAGGWLPPSVVGSGWGVMDAILTPGDFDGNGTVDLAARDGRGALHLYNTDGTGGWGGISTIGQGWDVMRIIGGAGDFNVDATNDVFAIGSDGRLFAYYGNGAGGWTGVEAIGQGWQVFTAVF